ncbi:MAG: hypothetical protein INR62_02655 [Rhodospirillales bacterium]|nr:hypothetical protein [Acetobacter sp.]
MNQVYQTSAIRFDPPLPRQVANYLWRATWLKCPVCGTRPIFPTLHRTRRLTDWFTPLDWCPNCRYLYEREPGYFLLSQWAIGYGLGALVGVLIYFYLQAYHRDWSLVSTLLVAVLPIPVVNVLFARHAKAYFLALDHLIDPHIRSAEDGDPFDAVTGTVILAASRTDLSGGEGGEDPAGQPGSGIQREEEAGRRRDG